MYDIASVLRAFRIVQTKFPSATLGIVGEGSEGDRLSCLSRAWGLRGVKFYGAVPFSELPSIYQQHDICVNASRVDNFPGVLIEAACSGLPIVTTDAGGIPDMIRDRENGLLVRVGDYEGLAAGVLELLQNPIFAQQLARTARTWAEQFSWSNVFSELLQCYGFQPGSPVHPPSSRHSCAEPVAMGGQL